MKSSSVAARILLGWIALVVCRLIAGILVAAKMPSAPHHFIWAMGTDLLTVTVLGLVAMRSPWQGPRLGLALFAIPFGIAAANLIEGSVFLAHFGVDWRLALVSQFLTYSLAATAWTIIFSGQGKTNEKFAWPRRLGAKLWRFIASDFVYLVLYFTAGMIIYPMVKNFYATQTLPPLGKLLALQLGVRGPVFVAICLLIYRMVRLPRVTGALAVGATFALLSGIVPLLAPSPFFPNAVRWVHLSEVGISNFLLGAFVVWLWG
jgi:hypothetical protein